MSNHWYYIQDGKQSGPVSDNQLQELLEIGDISQDSKVWKEGMADWLPYKVRNTIIKTETDLQAEEEQRKQEEEAAEPPKELGKYQLLSILAMLIGLLNPFGAFAFVYSLQAKNAHSDGRLDDMTKKLALCKRMLIIALIFSVILYALVGAYLGGVFT